MDGDVENNDSVSILAQQITVQRNAGFSVGDRFFDNFLLTAARLDESDEAIVLTHCKDRTSVTQIFDAMPRLGQLLKGQSQCPVGRSVHRRERIVPLRLDTLRARMEFRVPLRGPPGPAGPPGPQRRPRR